MDLVDWVFLIHLLSADPFCEITLHLLVCYSTRHQPAPYAKLFQNQRLFSSSTPNKVIYYYHCSERATLTTMMSNVLGLSLSLSLSPPPPIRGHALPPKTQALCHEVPPYTMASRTCVSHRWERRPPWVGRSGVCPTRRWARTCGTSARRPRRRCCWLRARRG